MFTEPDAIGVKDCPEKDVDLQLWGTFSLTWTACDTLDFDYNSTVPGYGSGSYDYTRVSTLQSTSCPPF
ncbi:MAG: hypothetical protein QNK19_01370 [Xanthomonadales bacterium]|nr:hypothetical protein [Xanthomonadales bacterium]